MTFTRVVRHVARTETLCNWCPYPIFPYQPAYSPTVGDVALATYCSERCAGRKTRGRIEVVYAPMPLTLLEAA